MDREGEMKIGKKREEMMQEDTRWIDSDEWCRARRSSADNHKHGLFVEVLKTTLFTLSMAWNSRDCADCPFSGAKVQAL